MDKKREPKDSIEISDNIGNITRKQRREQEKQAIAKLRTQNEQRKREAFKRRRERQLELQSLSKSEKKTFLLEEKQRLADEKRLVHQQRREQKYAFEAMTKPEKKQFKQAQKNQRRIEKRAKKSYVPIQILKYSLLAVLLAGLVYAGDIAYGAFIDNASAFQNTQQAMTTPSPTQTPQPEPSASETSAPTPTPDPYELLLDQADLEFMKNRVNILVLGIDESLERANWQSFRTDTMLLLSVDFDTGSVAMLSLPRDSYVWIYGKDVRDKINTAFAAGGGYKKNGFEYTMKTVSMTLGGVPVNHYVCFDMNVVKEVVNAIGGLEYDVEIDVKMNGRTISKGLQHMDGQMVLDYCRMRKGSSDIARVDRQQRMILAIFNEVKRTGQLAEIPAIYSAVTGNIYTDLTLKQIASLSAFAMKIDLEAIERHTLPGGFLNIDGTSFWGVNQKAKRSLIKQLFGVSININEADDLNTLTALAQQKRDAVTLAHATAANAQSYANANAAYISADEMNDLMSRINHMRTLADVKNTEDVGLTIPPITSAIDEFNAWFPGWQAHVESRKVAPAPPDPEQPPVE